MLHEQIKPADLVSLVDTNPVAVLQDETLYDAFYNHVKAEIEAFVPNLSTATSRKEISSLAYKVKRTKTAIDDAGKKLNEDARAKINAVDAQRRKVREDFDALSELARKPLTDWEKQEEARVEYCMAVLKSIEDCGNGFIGGEPYPYPILIRELEEKIVINAELGEFEEQARVAHRIALDKVKAAFEESQKRAAEQAELEALRAEKAKREQEEAERLEAERVAKEAAERERIEQERQAKAEAEYKANVERAAEEARQAEIAKAKAEQERIEREASEKIAAAEAEARALKEKAEREEQERKEAARREQAEKEARERDREHRGKIMGDAKVSLINLGLDEELARKVVLAIVSGHVEHVHIEF